MAKSTFKELEQTGWRQKANAYDAWFATITRQAIEPTLDALGDNFSETRLLDICTGTGHLAGAAAKRGALAEGLDFADAMVAEARTNYPKLTFQVGDAENLPYADATFDNVACGSGHLHFGDADQAIKEAHRVLVPGGRYAFTVWCGPDRGGEMFKLIIDAVHKHGNLDVPLPPAPPLFRFADPHESRTTLERLGFNDVQTSVLNLVWEPNRAEDILEMIYKSIVRTPMLLDLQTPEARQRIHADIVQNSEKHRIDNKLKLGFAAALVAASRT